MMIGKTRDLTRRALFSRLGSLGIVGSAAPFALNLAAVGDAAAITSNDYRALVCVFLHGGNDQSSTLIPYDSANYDLYSAIRGGGAGQTAGGIAYARADLANTALAPRVVQTLTDNQQYALSPYLTGLKGMWNLGRLAVQLNVGPLMQPTTISQYKSSNRTANPLPPRLFSHNDQASVWQSLAPEGSTTGWAGRMGDLAMAGNGNSLMTCISASGNAVFLSGESAVQYQIGATGALPVSGLKSPLFGSSACTDALSSLISQPRANIYEEEYAKVLRRSVAWEGVVNDAVNPVSLSTSFDLDGQANPLANQLKTVARLIGARHSLGVKRQVFFVQLSGFDTHDHQNQDHPVVMSRLNEALTAFYTATVEMGVADQVTTFTASDFGRTLSSNGTGTDHGWGSHHFVMGGAVNGGQYYGTAPQVSVTSDDQVGQGRLLPTTSVDQYAATLARWFGVSSSEIATIFPNIGRFGTADLGFMA